MTLELLAAEGQSVGSAGGGGTPTDGPSPQLLQQMGRHGRFP